MPPYIDAGGAQEIATKRSAKRATTFCVRVETPFVA